MLWMLVTWPGMPVGFIQSDFTCCGWMHVGLVLRQINGGLLARHTPTWARIQR